MRKAILLMFVLALIGCASDKLLFVSYQGWHADGTGVYTWSTITYPDKISGGEQLRGIANYLAKENGFDKVIILNFQRLEIPFDEKTFKKRKAEIDTVLTPENTPISEGKK